MSESLLDVVNNPILQQGVSLLTKTRPEIGLAIQLVLSLAQGWQTQSELNAAIKMIDERAAVHIKTLINPNLNPIERTEVEVRLHELLTVLIKLGGL